MKKDKEREFSNLRQQAEKILDGDSQALLSLPPKDVQELLHELDVHQIELEMQNEELRRTQLELGELYHQLSDLYDFAPVGYFVLDEKGIILKANLTGADLLGVDRKELIKKVFSSFVSREFHDAFYKYRKLLLKSKNKKECELKLVRKNKASFYARIECVPVRDDNGNLKTIRAVITDITKKKKAEKRIQEETRLNRVLLDNIPGAALLIRPETREIVLANKHALEFGAIPGKQCYVSRGKFSEPCPWCLAPDLWATGKAIHREVEISGTYWDTFWIPITEDLYLHYSLDITERKKVEKTMQLINESTVGEIGKDFLRSLTKQLAISLGTRYTLVGELVPFGEERIRTIAVWADGDYADNIEYNFVGTPCAEAIEQDFCIYSENIQQSFPDDHLLTEMGVESYVGIRLKNSSGDTVGILAALHDKPLSENILFIKPILTTFAIRAAAEIERKRVEEELYQSERKLKIKNEISRTFLSIHDEEVYEKILAIVLDALESKYGTFGYIDTERGGGFICSTMTRNIWKECQVSDKEIIIERGTWGGIWGRAIKEKRSLYSNKGPFNIPEGHIPIKNTMVVPIIYNDEVISAVHLANKPTDYNDKDLALLETIAEHIAPILKARLERNKKECEIRKLNEELEQRVSERTYELKKTWDKLLHAEKLTAIGKLSASIAHEFGSPIFGIRNVLCDLDANPSLEENDQEMVDLAIRECDRVTDLIKKLREFNRPTSSNIELMNIHKIIDDMLLFCKKKFIQRKIKVQKHYAPDMPEIHAIEDQIKQVILNLLNNAEEAIPDKGGTIKISTEHRENEITIRIEDSGVGIKSEFIDDIFEPFYTTKSAVKGTGLGLSTVYGIIRGHSGKIDVESDQDKGGTAFIITLPIDGTRNAQKNNFIG